jgi:GAF domain-containing protein
VTPEQMIGGSLVLLRQMMDMDVALLTEIAEDREVVLHAAGEWPGIDLSAASVPVEETFCQRLLAGEIDNIVPDVAAEPAVRDLEFPRRLGVQSYIGVPIHGSRSGLYVLCCLAREAHPELGPRDVRVLEGFVRSLLDQLEQPAPAVP